MLNKKFRLLTKFEFNISRKYGQRYSGKFFHIFVLKPKYSEPNTRVGFVVPNKLSKSAVKRNRVKRLFRQTVRENFGNIKGNWWIVIHPKFESLGKSYEEISSDYTQVLQKLPISR